MKKVPASLEMTAAEEINICLLFLTLIKKLLINIPAILP